MVRNKHNNPSIIKYNFWHQVYQNPKAAYVCLNKDSANAPAEIADRSICIAGDSVKVLADLIT